MAVTLYRQVVKGKARPTRRSILGAGADRPISPVPTPYGIRWLTVPVPGRPLATTSMRQSRRRSKQCCGLLRLPAALSLPELRVPDQISGRA